MTATQAASVLHHLRHTGPITPLEALRQLGCMRLGARIYDLRRDGHVIVREMIRTPSGKRVARYTLIKERTAA